ncbi:MAG TPA: hypothetical protein VFT21_06525, partial [Gemmatimonadaceae bacterium]|nr:hypothetical protein [Gemmatimonadaceae bacterium]
TAVPDTGPAGATGCGFVSCAGVTLGFGGTMGVGGGATTAAASGAVERSSTYCSRWPEATSPEPELPPPPPAGPGPPPPSVGLPLNPFCAAG